MDTTMHTSWILLAPILIGIVLLLGAIALIAALVTNPRTRVVGVVLGGVAGVVVVLGAVAFFALTTLRRDVAIERATAERAEDRGQYAVKHTEVDGAGDAHGLVPETASAGEAASTRASEPPEKASGVLPAVGNSLARAASETGVAKASRSVQETPGVLAAAFRALGRAIALEQKRRSRDVESARPAWVDAEPGMVNGAYQVMAMVTGPSRQECDEAQPEELQKAAALYVEHELGPGAARAIRLSPEFLQKHVVGDAWEETVTVDYGRDLGRRPTILRHVLLRFGPDADEELHKLARTVTIRRRLRLAAYGLVAVLAALGLAFAYLKINLTTGGRYRGRLRAAAIAVILAAVAANALILAS